MKLATTAARAFMAFALCVLSSIVMAQERLPMSNGNGLLSRAEADERTTQGRASGLDAQHSGQWQGFIAGAAWTLDDFDPKVCLPAAATVGQLSAVVLRYLRQNPAQLHRDSSNLVREALQQAFPCR
jgi:hypothetical protein